MSHRNKQIKSTNNISTKSQPKFKSKIQQKWNFPTLKLDYLTNVPPVPFYERPDRDWYPYSQVTYEPGIYSSIYTTINPFVKFHPEYIQFMLTHHRHLGSILT